MKYTIKTFAATILLAAQATTMTADNFGYCTSTVDRENIFSMGSTEKQGLAIKLPASKIAELKGNTISSISAAFGSKRMTNGSVELFIATSLDGTPLLKQTATVSSATKWLDFALDTPYTISGDEPALYIGYTGDITVGSTMLMGDATADMSDTSFAFNNGNWVDLYGMDYGCALIRFGIDNAPQITDMVIKPVKVEGYFRAKQDYSLQCQLFNFGNKTVNSFSFSTKVDGQTVAVETIDNLAIAPGETYDVTMPSWRSETEGIVNLDMQVAVEGEADNADNIFAANAFFYPADMERAILLEGFTGQDCSNCPRGHEEINKFLAEATTPVVEVMHHAGYSPDNFTMDADLDYTYFYGSTSTYAPAVMLNRTVVYGAVPVMNASENYLLYGYSRIEEMQPYMSLSLESIFNQDTRQLTIELNTLCHYDMPSAMNVINVMMVQDGMVGRQSPYGEGYVHNNVMRNVLTGNSWGVQLSSEACKAGGRSKWSTSLTLPDATFSDFYNPANLTPDEIALYTHPTDPANMKLVAYVAAYGNSPSSHSVYNTVEVPLGESYMQGGYTAISEIKNNEENKVLNGIYTIAGTKVESMDKPGLYIVNGKKILIK